MVITEKNLLESGLLLRFNGYGGVHVMDINFTLELNNSVTLLVRPEIKSKVLNFLILEKFVIYRYKYLMRELPNFTRHKSKLCVRENY